MALLERTITLSIDGYDYVAGVSDDLYIFRNIPYAKLERFSDGGYNIFGQPIDIEPEDCMDLPPEKSRTTVNTTAPGPMALQTLRTVKAYISPQCQNFNIWVPARIFDQREKAPVLFYVHGGSFKSGSNQNPELDGKDLARAQQIIVVEPNFRIGPAGFINFSGLDSRCGSNMAFHDILSALRWVQRHIGAFGGDPGNVTLMGESAGGTIVSIFPFLEEASGMFSKLVIFSGIPSAFTPPEAHDYRAARFVEFVGAENVQELFQPHMWQKIADAANPFTEAINFGAATYMPTVDNDLIRDNAVCMMYKAAQAGKTLDIPVWSNMTEDELSIMAVMPRIFGRWGMDNLMDQAYVEEGHHQVGTMRQIYQETYGANRASQVYSDMIIRSVLIWYMQFASQCTNAYFTRLDWKSPMQKLTGLGAFHSSDLYIVFNSLDNLTGRAFFKGLGAKSAGRNQLVEHMQADLGRFMREGKLNGPDRRQELMPFDPDENLLKAYDVPCRMETVWLEELDHAWKQTKYYKIVLDEGREETIKNLKLD